MLNNDKPDNRKYALITGATVGIGYELSKLFAADGYNLVLVARNKSLLEERQIEMQKNYGISVTVIPLDLSRQESAMELHEAVLSQRLVIDILVNNAGYGLSGYFSETSLETEVNMINLNVTALTRLCKLFLRDMAERGGGRIMNVASTASFFPGPGMAVYYATKAFVLSLSQALSIEAAKYGVTVTTLCPGPVRTNFQNRAGIENARVARFSMEVGAVARKGYRALMKGQAMVVPGVLNKLSVFSQRLLPRLFLARIIYWLHK